MSDDTMDRTDVATVPAIQPLPVERVLQAIITAAENPATDVGKMRELLGFQKELMAMQAELAFNEAFHRLSLALPRIQKNGVLQYPVDKNQPNGQKRKIANFAKWEDIDAVIRPLMQREGFTLSFDTEPRPGEGGGIIVTGTLSHVAGHKRMSSIPLALDNSGGKNNIQGMGSTFSYGKRYTATALLNIITEGDDDDGERGGMSFISEEEVAELNELLKRSGRQESTFLDQMFGGEVRTFEEIQKGGFLPVRNALLIIVRAKEKSA